MDLVLLFLAGWGGLSPYENNLNTYLKCDSLFKSRALHFYASHLEAPKISDSPRLLNVYSFIKQVCQVLTIGTLLTGGSQGKDATDC
jgi:hypothetical protein